MSSLVEKNLQLITERDIRLLRRIAARDEDAISELYDLYAKYMLSTIYFILKDKAESEDVLQDVLLTIWNKINSYDQTLGNPISWIIRITRNRAIDRLRVRKNNTSIEFISETTILDLEEDSKSVDPEYNTDLKREKAAVIEVLKTLDEVQRNLIVFSYYKGYTHTELAEYFKMPLGTVKTKIRSAMMVMRENLKHLK